MELSRDLGSHETILYGNGNAVNLERLDLHCFIKRHVNGLFSLKESAEFPGSRPTVLSHLDFARISEAHKKFLAEKKGKTILPPFFVTEKTDGKRMYLFFCSLDHQRKFQVAIDSKYNMRLVHFDVPNEFYEGTLFDGELVEDEDPVTHERKFVLYVFDCLESMGTPIRKQWFSDRLYTAKKLLPMIDLVAAPGMRSPFEIRLKHFYPLEKIADLLHSKLPHPSDGIIVNRNEAAAGCFHCPHTFKWKSLRDSTMDFLLLFDYEKNTCAFYTKKQKKPCFRQNLDATLKKCSQTYSENAPKSDRLCHPVVPLPRDHLQLQIVECFYCPHEKLWKPKKKRPDKEFPNSLHVLQETIKIMKTPIYLAQIVQAWTKM